MVPRILAQAVVMACGLKLKENDNARKYIWRDFL